MLNFHRESVDPDIDGPAQVKPGDPQNTNCSVSGDGVLRTTRAIEPDQTNVGIFNQESARRGVKLTSLEERLPFPDEERQIRSSGNREPTAVGEAEASLNQKDVPDPQAGIGKCD